MSLLIFPVNKNSLLISLQFHFCETFVSHNKAFRVVGYATISSFRRMGSRCRISDLAFFASRLEDELLEERKKRLTPLDYPFTIHSFHKTSKEVTC